ncbi:MAG: YraN family protein [Bacteroidaceae bacterium]|nr:YraN family protein [Bacteroidaceae bacterium]
MTESWQLGQTGEELAADYLMKQGYSILHHNWNLHHGCELDLVARKNGELHFVEVKTRRRESEVFGSPEMAVDWRKMRHIQSAISYYMSFYGIDKDTPIHMDAIGVVYRGEDDFDLRFLQDIHYFEFTRSSYNGRQGGWRYM